MDWPRYWVEVNKVSRVVVVAHIITYSALLAQGGRQESYQSENEMVEIPSIADIPDFPNVVGSYKLDDDNKLVLGRPDALPRTT